eukprot:CAMPEP_0117423788 /NCGR_PEP_ID=MMETSP0758-20121206/4330_1 /TAXON_ID=63605 /ORGANISM="Percolomonas cosmopolitus, Strain AE-1 (ATCC 50343)" /LENGTH=489 /DNA_ID=CAMNT_0005207163 /DNA_START=803 /DNA_END=2272 /DNA_ORIENTATION=-
MDTQYLNQMGSIIWTLDSPLSTWSITFYDKTEEEEMKKRWAACLYEAGSQRMFHDLSEYDQRMVVESYQIDQVTGIKEENTGYVASDFMEFEEDDEDYEEEYEEEYGTQKQQEYGQKQKGPKNKLLVDSVRHQRAFVGRGNAIGVFRRDTDDAVFDTMINNLQTPEGITLNPKTMMLHNQEGEILMTHPDQQHAKTAGKIYKLDLNKGKVVEAYQAAPEWTVDRIGVVQKYSEQLNQEVFVGLNNNSVFGIDPRIRSEHKGIGNLASYRYKTNPKFTCFATSMKGELVVGAQDGQIRMYSGTPGLDKLTGNGLNPKTAKTALPGCGDPIRGLDVTANGDWIVATCDTYLLAIPTHNVKDAQKNGFNSRLGQYKPTPRRLQLLPLDRARIGKTIKFTPARFNTGVDGEIWIITSTGDYLISWNFRKVKQNQLCDYAMKRMGDTISAEQFLSVPQHASGADAPILVLLNDDVCLEKRHQVSHNPYKARPTF